VRAEALDGRRSCRLLAAGYASAGGSRDAASRATTASRDYEQSAIGDRGERACDSARGGEGLQAALALRRATSLHLHDCRACCSSMMRSMANGEHYLASLFSTL